jgi:predicted dehydrogenase
MKLAVLGLGFMGSTHLKALRGIPGVELAAVLDQDEKRLSGDLSSVQGNLGAPGEKIDLSGVKKYRELGPLLADPEIAAIDICLPTHLHEGVAIEALRVGKHVLVEKPMALDALAAERMVRVAARHKRILMTAHVLRFFPAYVALREAVRGGRLGRVRFAVFRRRCAEPAWAGWLKDPAQSGGGVFDLLIHDTDMCLHLFGKPEAVSATGYSDQAAGIDGMHAQLFYPDGAVVLITGGWHHPGAYPFSMEYTVTLDGGTVEYSSAGRGPALYGPNQPEQILPLKDREPYGAEIEYFVECCRAGRAPELCPPRESANAVKLMLLMLEARHRKGAKLRCNI